MNSEIEYKLLQMFNEISLKQNYERGCSSEIEVTKDETSLTKIYTQKFIFGKGNKDYKYKGYVITDLDNNVIEEKYEEI